MASSSERICPRSSAMPTRAEVNDLATENDVASERSSYPWKYASCRMTPSRATSRPVVSLARRRSPSERSSPSNA
jgi:hypothetical protein